MTAVTIFQFGEFAFDEGRRQLLKQGQPVPLTPQAFDLLGLLIARRPRVVPSRELLAALWPDTHVGRTSVARLVSEIRHALGDDPRQPRFVRTAHRLGYAFLDQGQDPPPLVRPGCRLIWGGHEFTLEEGENLVGRTSEAAVRIPSAKVSRRHARIRVDGGRAWLEDLGSRNGTFLGKRRIDAPVPLADGDEIGIGGAVLVFVSAASAASITRDD